MKIAEILAQKGIAVIAVAPGTTVSGAAVLMADQVIGVAAVIDPDKGLLGILSERDITRGLAQSGAKVADMCVEELMSRDVVFCGPNRDVAQAFKLMQERNMRRMPVIDNDNHLVGMVSIRDLMETQSEELHKVQ